MSFDIRMERRMSGQSRKGLQPVDFRNSDAGWKPAPQNCASRMAANASESTATGKENVNKTPQEIAQESEPPLTAGSCLLRKPKLAKIVQDALLYFEGRRYFLSSWCIMPNHVHVVVTPLLRHNLSTFCIPGNHSLLTRSTKHKEERAHCGSVNRSTT